MLEFDGLHKSFGDNHVLDGVGFTVAPGSMFGFCGSNGAGKTTTMRIAMGLVRADAGEVRWQGRPLDQETRRRIGYMPEERGLYPKMKVGEQVTYFARLHGLDARRGRARRRRVGRAARPRRAPRRPGREAVAGQPAARPAGRRAGQPARGADPRRAVLRPRPGRRRLARRGAARARCRAGRAGRLLQPPARPRRAAVRLGRHPRPRPHGRHRHGRGAAPPGGRPAAAGRRPGRRRTAGRPRCPASAWSRSRPGTPCWSSTAGTDDQAVLAAALRTGRVTHFAWREPTLVELFREVVAAPTEEVAA